MTTAFVFIITVVTIAHPIHMLFTVHHLLLVLSNERERICDKKSWLKRESGVRACLANIFANSVERL